MLFYIHHLIPFFNLLTLTHPQIHLSLLALVLAKWLIVE
jgi:hypothetical protein